MSESRTVFLSVLSLGCIISLPVAAQTANDAANNPASLKPVASSTGAVDLDMITVTATRQPTLALDAPATVTVISREQIQSRVTRDVQDLMRYQPGVDIGRVTSATDPWHNLGSFTIRGVTNNRVQILVDGTRVIERITDGTRDLVDLPFIRQVEILRGPGSTLWGADALGGIVSYSNLEPDDLLAGKRKNWAVRSDVGYDSFDRSFSKSVIGAVQAGEWQVLAGFNHRTAHEPKLTTARADGGVAGCPRTLRFLPCNVLDPVDTSGINFLGKIVFRPTPDQQFKLTGELFDRKSTVTQLYDYGIVSSSIRNGDYSRDQDLSRYRIQFAHQWNVGLPLLDGIRWNVSYSPQERSLTNRRTQFTSNNQTRYTLGTLNYREEFLQGDIQFSSSFRLLGTEHRLTYGFQGDRILTDYRRQDIVRNLSTNVTTVTRGGGFNFANATTTRADGYLQDEIALMNGRLTVSPGLRFANYTIDPRPDRDYRIVPGKAPRRLDSSRLIPQIGAVFRLDDVYALYGRYAEGFKMPTSQQLFTSMPFGSSNLVPNPDLRPETVRSYEAGVRGRFEDGWFSLGAFHTEYKDFIQELFQIPGTTDYTSRNLSRVQLSGIEASAEWAFTESLVATSSLSYQYGNQKVRPGAIRTAFDAASPFKAVVGLKWISPRYGLETEVLATFASPVSRASIPTYFKADGYTVWDAYLNWRPTENLKIRAGVQNIFEARYFPTIRGYDLGTTDMRVFAQNPLELQVGAGRTWKIGATLDF
ncbi:Heme/hemopexin utilization protein C [Methylorubrum suomiense]|uniref:Heme/hemopexin utilization protein C n=2 Tax=Methylorubrum suomiense TaxID=144191 RepID=A0ABQ4UUL6_9HYPH|nr:Heme/hemopexin utilization protein C [Methylorubrum suomiense]